MQHSILNEQMIIFFETKQNTIIAVDSIERQSEKDLKKLIWLFDEAKKTDEDFVEGHFFGPRRE